MCPAPQCLQLHCCLAFLLCCHGTTQQGAATSPLLTVYLLDAGFFNMPGYKPTNITFFLESDDASLMTIDGNVVISDSGTLLRMQHSNAV